MFTKSKFLFLYLLCFIVLIAQPCITYAAALTAEDLASSYQNKDLGISIKIPHTWTHDISGEVIEKARDTAHDLTSKAMGVPKEFVQKIDAQGSDKMILIRMRVTSPAIPAAQITTRSFRGVENPPQSALENLQRYMKFVKTMTPVTVIESVAETELNGCPCAHVAYHTQILLEGYTYLARYDVYSFWRKDRTIDLSIIDNRNAAFKTQNEMDIGTVLNSVRINN